MIYPTGSQELSEGGSLGLPPSGSHGKNPACNVGDLGSIAGQGRSLEKEMATPFSIPAWRIPWTEEPGRLQSMGSQELDTAQLLSHQHFGYPGKNDQA